MIPRAFRLCPRFLLVLILFAAGCGGGGGGGGSSAQNLAPVLDPIGNQVVAVGETLSIPLRAGDPNIKDTVRIFTSIQSDVRLSATSGNPASAIFRWTPTSDDLSNNNDTPVAITFTASDGLLEVSQTIIITVKAPVSPPPANPPPVLAPIGNRSIDAGSNLSFTVSASDPDGDAVSLNVVDPPAGASFDQSTGVFSWTPGPADLGNHNLTFSASDGLLEVSQTIIITVNAPVPPPPVNAPPVLAPIGNRSIDAGNNLSFTVSASDPDGDAVSLNVTDLPAGASFNAGTGAFSWTPGPADLGNHNLTFSASDGLLEVSQTIIITVNAAVSPPPTNNPPVLAPIGNRSIDAGSSLSFTVSASDPDGDAVSLNVADLPASASFNAGTGAFSWIPGPADLGNHNLSFSASDGLLEVSQTIIITVNAPVPPPPANTPPVLAPIGNRSIDAGSSLSFTVSASDPDGDAVSLNVADLPAGASFNAGTGAFSWTPGPADLGNHNLTFSASDGLLEVSQTIIITVNAPIPANSPPVLAPIGNRSINDGSNLSFTVSASDPDGDAVSLNVAGLPAGASFDAGTGAFSWTPGPADLGNHNLTFSASDGTAPPVEEQIVISVVNNAPVITITQPPPASVTENEPLTIGFSVMEPDPEDVITVTVSGSAVDFGGMVSYDPATQTGTFTWTPALVTAGSFSVTIAASDGSSAVAATQTIVYVRTNPLLASDISAPTLPGITIFPQTTPARDGVPELFPGQANFWDIDPDIAQFDGFWDQFDGNLLLGIDAGAGEEFFLNDQAYEQLTYMTPLLTAQDGLVAAAVASHSSYAGPDPLNPIAAEADEGSASAWLNATADSRLQQLLDLRQASGTLTLSWKDEYLVQSGAFFDHPEADAPYYRVVVTDQATGLRTEIFNGPLINNVVQTSPTPRTRETHNVNLSAMVGKQLLLSFELRGGHQLLLDPADNPLFLGSYARIDNVSLRDGSNTELVVNGGFENGMTGWSANAGRQSQNLRSAPRTLAGLNVTRHFYSVPNQLWARWTEVLENPTAAPISAQVIMTTFLGSAFKGIIYADNPIAPRALTSWDGTDPNGLTRPDRDIGLVFGNIGDPANLSFTSASALDTPDGDDVIQIAHDVTVPAGGRVTLVHFAIMNGENTGAGALDVTARATSIDSEIARILDNFHTDPRYRDGMTQAQLDSLVNF